MAPDLDLLFEGGDTDFHAALIGLGRRGCECIRRLRRSGLADAYAFLIDHDPESRQEDTPPEHTCWIGTSKPCRIFRRVGCWAW